MPPCSWPLADPWFVEKKEDEQLFADEREKLPARKFTFPKTRKAPSEDAAQLRRRGDAFQAGVGCHRGQRDGAWERSSERRRVSMYSWRKAAGETLVKSPPKRPQQLLNSRGR